MNNYLYLLLGRLVDKYASIKKALDILMQMYPANKRIHQLSDDLKRGKKPNELFTKNGFEKQISFYCQYLPLSKAIAVAYKKKEQKDKIIKQFSSKMSYQILLLVSSIIILFIFANLVMPTMLESLDINNSKTLSLINTFNVVSAIADATIIVLTIIVVVVVYIVLFKRLNYLWLLLHKYKIDNTFKTMATYLFVCDLAILLENGLTLDRCLDIMRLSKNHHLSNLISYQMYDSLSQGHLFEDCLQNEFIDPQFRSVCLYDLQDSGFAAALANYQEIIEMKIEVVLRNCSIAIQGFCYGFVAIVIVLAYQVLMLPLEILQEV